MKTTMRTWSGSVIPHLDPGPGTYSPTHRTKIQRLLGLNGPDSGPLGPVLGVAGPGPEGKSRIEMADEPLSNTFSRFHHR